MIGTMRPLHPLLFGFAIVLPLAFGCTAAPRVRPVEAGPVDTGAQSVEAARRQLQGTWELVALELYSSTGAKTAAEASGRLQYDEFGNLTMRGTIAGSSDIDPSVLNVSGRIVIDPATRTFRFQDISAPNADQKRIDPQLAASHVRYYEVAGDRLTITVKSASGAPTATATWRRIN
jgi:hypothetical protein